MAGMTRREQWGLLGMIALVLGGLGVQQLRRGDAVPVALTAPESGAWQTLATLDVTPTPAAPPPAVAVQAASPALPAALPAAAPAVPPAPLGAPPAPVARQAGPLDLNTATAAQLEDLPGIGATKAAAILTTRERLGGFRSVEQLDAVPGIGAKTMDQLRPLVTVGGAGAPPSGTVTPPGGTAVPGVAPAATPASPSISSPAAPQDVAQADQAQAAPVSPKEPASTGPQTAPPVATAVPQAAPTSRPSARPLTMNLVNLNTASAAQLESVNGIGPVLARRIIEHRTRLGPFASVDQLDDVSGIGPKTLEKMRPYLTVQ